MNITKDEKKELGKWSDNIKEKFKKSEIDGRRRLVIGYDASLGISLAKSSVGEANKLIESIEFLANGGKFSASLEEACDHIMMESLRDVPDSEILFNTYIDLKKKPINNNFIEKEYNKEKSNHTHDEEHLKNLIENDCFIAASLSNTMSATEKSEYLMKGAEIGDPRCIFELAKLYPNEGKKLLPHLFDGRYGIDNLIEVLKISDEIKQSRKNEFALKVRNECNINLRTRHLLTDYSQYMVNVLATETNTVRIVNSITDIFQLYPTIQDKEILIQVQLMQNKNQLDKNKLLDDLEKSKPLLLLLALNYEHKDLQKDLCNENLSLAKLINQRTSDQRYEETNEKYTIKAIYPGALLDVLLGNQLTDKFLQPYTDIKTLNDKISFILDLYNNGHHPDVRAVIAAKLIPSLMALKDKLNIDVLLKFKNSSLFKEMEKYPSFEFSNLVNAGLIKQLNEISQQWRPFSHQIENLILDNRKMEHDISDVNMVESAFGQTSNTSKAIAAEKTHKQNHARWFANSAPEKVKSNEISLTTNGLRK